MDAKVEQAMKSLKDQGAELGEPEKMGKRRLAYEIDDVREGYYVVLRFKSQPDVVKPASSTKNVISERICVLSRDDLHSGPTLMACGQTGRVGLSVQAADRRTSKTANEFCVRSEERTTYERAVYHSKISNVKKKFFEWVRAMTLAITAARHLVG